MPARRAEVVATWDEGKLLRGVRLDAAPPYRAGQALNICHEGSSAMFALATAYGHGRSPELLARTIVHESSHKFDGTDDEEYCYTGCNSIDRWDAYDNADSYARFAWEAYTTLP